MLNNRALFSPFPFPSCHCYYKHQLFAFAVLRSQKIKKSGIINEAKTLYPLNNLFLRAAFNSKKYASLARDGVSMFSSDYSGALIAEQCQTSVLAGLFSQYRCQ